MDVTRFAAWAGRAAPRTVRGRLLGSTALVAVLVSLGAIVLIAVVQRQRDAAQRRSEADRVVALANRAERLVVDLETGTRGYLVTGQEVFLEPYRAALPELPAVVARLRRSVAGDPLSVPLAIRVDRAAGAYIDDYARPLVARARAERTGAVSVAATSEGKRRVDALRALIERIVNRQQRVAAARAREAESAAGRGLTLAVGVLVGSLLLQLALAAYRGRKISRPIRRTARAADQLAAGDLTTRVPTRGPSELTGLGQSFNRMAQALEAGRAQLEEQNVALAEARAEADRANSTKSRFLSRMSHELRTPLTAIIGYSDLLELDDLTPDQQDSVDRIRGGGRHLLHLIEELVDISRIEAGEMQLNLEAVDAATSVEEAVSLIAPMALERSIDIEVACDAAPEDVLADPQRLRQVLINLLSNGVKYNRDGGRVTVAAAVAGTGAAVEFVVRDTGQGISAEGMERLFVPFDRLGAERTAVGGSGLGLVITKRMIEAMGGRLDIDSVEGEGTVCRFTLTRANARDPEPA